MIDLSTTYVGLKLKNPIIIASSNLTNSLPNILACEEAGAGAVILKSIFEEQLIAQEQKVGAKGDGFSDRVDNYYKNGLFLQLDNYVELIRQGKKEMKIPVIASVNCISAKNYWMPFLREIEKAGADALEVNVAVMPKSFKQTPYEIETHIFKIIYEISQHTKMPVLAKIAPYYTSIPKIARGLQKNGAASVVLFNRFYQPDIDPEGVKFKSKGKYSTENDLSISLRWISMLYKQIKCDLAGATGVHTGEGAIKLILSGASAIEICSVLYLKGMGYLDQLLLEMKGWLSKNQYESISQIQGILSQKNKDFPEFFERFQYIEAMEGME
ncbi:MAG: dihydroorotate dehydrogenase-like protein [Candidatus Cyclobacteriaceae bacterium M3_2C_046]